MQAAREGGEEGGSGPGMWGTRRGGWRRERDGMGHPGARKSCDVGALGWVYDTRAPHPTPGAGGLAAQTDRSEKRQRALRGRQRGVGGSLGELSLRWGLLLGGTWRPPHTPAVEAAAALVLLSHFLSCLSHPRGWVRSVSPQRGELCPPQNVFQSSPPVPVNMSYLESLCRRKLKISR